MPLVVAPLVAIALGALFGFALGPAERAADVHFARRVVALFAAIGFAPVPGYFAWSAPSWSLGYLFDGERFPSALSLTIVLGSAALVVVAFELTERALSEGHARRALGAAFAAVAFGGAILAALAGRLSQVGSYAEVTGGFSVPSLPTTSVGLAALVMNGLLGASTWIALSALRPPRPSSPSAPPKIGLRAATTAASVGSNAAPVATRALEPTRRRPRPTSPPRTRR